MLVKIEIDDTSNDSANAHQEDQEEQEGEDAEDIEDYFFENEMESSDLNINFSEANAGEIKRSRSVSVDRRASSIRRTKTVFENNYRMEPKPENVFSWFKAKGILNSVVGPMFAGFVYETKAAAIMCKLICSKVMSMVKKKLDSPRHRFVCHVTMVEMKKQGVIIADRSLWLTLTDNCASSTFVKKDMVVVVTLHAIYFD